MQFNGWRLCRRLIVTLAAIVWLAFVWFLIPNRVVTYEIQLTMNRPAIELSSPDSSPGLFAKLLSLEIPPRTADTGELNVRDGDQETTAQVSEDQKITIEDTEYEVTAIRPWAGLLHRPPGLPMMNIAVKPPDANWIENVFVERGGAQILTPAIAVFVGVVDTGIEANPSRWGVVEGDRTHWFSSFVPGTGLDLDDGRAVTLLAHRPSGWIRVRVEAGGETTETLVEANRYPTDGQFRYEDPNAVAYKIEINVDENGPSTISVVEGDLELWTTPWAIGSMLVDEDSGLSVRIDQDELEALPLFADESPWLEVVLTNLDQVIRIREGEAVRVGETTATFEAFAHPQPARAQIAIGTDTVSFVEDTEYESADRRFYGMRTLSPTTVALEVAQTHHLEALRTGLTALLILAAIAYLYLDRRKA
jgi:hypothetical protein